ncbi:unnamed protein product, partial [Closterium sp. NIES-53]
MGSGICDCAFLRRLKNHLATRGICDCAFLRRLKNHLATRGICDCAFLRRLKNHLATRGICDCAFLALHGTCSHISNLGADVWRQGGVDFTGTLMVFTLKISGCAMDYQDGALPEDK